MDFSKVTNFFSDLLGNPFSTPVGQLIGIPLLFVFFIIDYRSSS